MPGSDVVMHVVCVCVCVHAHVCACVCVDSIRYCMNIIYSQGMGNQRDLLYITVIDKQPLSCIRSIIYILQLYDSIVL